MFKMAAYTASKFKLSGILDSEWVSIQHSLFKYYLRIIIACLLELQEPVAAASHPYISMTYILYTVTVCGSIYNEFLVMSPWQHV